jgi:pimeloyl-ACP methyl ester carboxylesterase
MNPILRRCFLGLVLLHLSARADGPADNVPDKVRPVPPPGIQIAEEVRAELSSQAAQLGADLNTVREKLGKRPALRSRWADAAIFQKSVDWAIRYNEIFKTNEIATAREQLKTGRARLEALNSGVTPWANETGPTVRGYESRIDGSVQPYGLVVPTSWTPNSGRRWRLDFWFHGRGETLSELAFIQDRSRNLGEFTPPDTFVLHLYGRYCNGSRFAGETDFWEALADVRRLYPIDEDRMIIRGFSLGGASAWHFTAHYASLWAASAPGAGFSETAEFLNVFQKEKLQPFPWEQKLWRLHDATANASNLRMIPLVAYSGADDSQIQAARAVEKAMAELGLKLTHLVGPKTGHKYEPVTKAELNRRIDLLANRGRNRSPRDLSFVTHSLRYPTMAWFTIDGMGEHWEPASVRSLPPTGDSARFINTTNVTAFSIHVETGDDPFPEMERVTFAISGNLPGQTPKRIDLGVRGSDGSIDASFHWSGAEWVPGRFPDGTLRKKHGLQGPIDDAFMDRFVFVLPTGQPMNEGTGKWVSSEVTRAREHWRRHYRGDAPVVEDTALTDDQIAKANLILWGDPASNRVLARILPKLPIQWSNETLAMNGKTYPSTNHVPVLIFPNPLNPERYVVVNSSFTFREYDYLNNARQTPKLPDWATIDLSTPPNSRYPGKIAAGGFFDEQWSWK